MTIAQEVQKLNPDAMVELFKLDGGAVGGEVLYFHGMTEQGPIWWQGTQYDPWPLKAEGFARTSQQQPTPKLSVANLDGSITELCRLFDDMVGTVVTRVRTFVKYLDNENFGKKNLLKYTQNFDQSPNWLSLNAVTVTPNTQSAPDFTTTADTLTIPTGLSGRYQEVTVIPGMDYTFTVYGKRGTLAQADYKMAVYDVTNSAWISQDYVPSPQITVTEWTRMELHFKVPATCTTIRVYPYRNSNSASAGDIYLWGAQLELGISETTYERKDASGVNPTADPTQEFPPEVWFIERKSSENNEAVQFELASAFDLQNVRLPRRQIISNYCTWKSVGGYRGPYCGYTGIPVAKDDGTPTSDPGLDNCGGKLSDCKLRQWPDGVLNFGGFPAAGLMRT